MQGLRWSRARTAILGLGLVCLPVLATAQTARHSGTGKRPVLRRRAETPEGRARDHWAETWAAASAKRPARAKNKAHDPRALRVAKLCRPSPRGREMCATVREVGWQR